LGEDCLISNSEYLVFSGIDKDLEKKPVNNFLEDKDHTPCTTWFIPRVYTKVLIIIIYYAKGLNKLLS